MAAALDRQPVTGWTHNFYRYPARFSPRFAAAAISCFSQPADVVLDPYMGGGTSVVEALALGRRVIGNDLNPLATFIARVKTTQLTQVDVRAVRRWADTVVPTLSYWTPSEEIDAYIDEPRVRNLTLSRAKFIKKAVAGALAAIATLPTLNAQAFARCVVLRVAQWALDGRRGHTPLGEFRSKLTASAHEMLGSLRTFLERVRQKIGDPRKAVSLFNEDAAKIERLPCFAGKGERPRLVVTSPPYPGVHVLYHRWQVDGRRETPAPFWIAGCNDGQGASFYNFGDRRKSGLDAYFQWSVRTLQAIRRVVAAGAYMVQMLAFSDPKNQLPRYLSNMQGAGFTEVVPFPDRSGARAKRIWREVPHRKWHAALSGKTHCSREVVLVHRAV